MLSPKSPILPLLRKWAGSVCEGDCIVRKTNNSRRTARRTSHQRRARSATSRRSGQSRGSDRGGTPGRAQRRRRSAARSTPTRATVSRRWCSEASPARRIGRGVGGGALLERQRTAQRRTFAMSSVTTQNWRSPPSGWWLTIPMTMTMFGWCSFVITVTSSRNPWAASRWDAAPARTTLHATVDPRYFAAKTSPKPPRPRRRSLSIVSADGSMTQPSRASATATAAATA